MENHCHKYDTLFISYDTEITPYQSEVTASTWYEGYEHAIGGPLIPVFVDAVSKYSDYDVSEIRQEIKRKQEWYYARNPK